MSNYLTLEEAIEEIKNKGAQEEQTIAVAEKVADIINAIVRARMKKNMSQRELAERTGFGQSTIARMETLQTIPRIDTLLRIAECLDLRIEVESKVSARSTYSASIDSAGIQYNLCGWNTSSIYHAGRPKAAYGGA